MACRLHTLRSFHPTIPAHRTFTTSPSHRKLGAATYAQEWNTGTYHYNKSASKLAPFAHQQTDKLLQQYITQQKKSAGGFGSKASIASHRRQYEKMYVSGSRVKDFGGRVEVEAYVFDGQKATEREQKAREARFGRVRQQGQEGGGAKGKGGGSGGQQAAASGAR